MFSFLKRRKRLTTLAGVLVIAVLVAVWFLFFQQPPDMREALSVRSEWLAAREDMDVPTKERLASRCLEISRKYPDTLGGLLALQMASAFAPETEPGRQARQQFIQQIETADIGRLAQVFDLGVGSWQAQADLAPTILARARRSGEHPRTGRLLAAVCVMTRPSNNGEPSITYTEAANLIADSHAGSADIANFCEGLGASPSGSPTWAHQFEKHLRSILEQNRDRKVRCAAQFALANVVQSSGEERQAEAEALFEQFCSEFDGKYSYRYQQIEGEFRRLAEVQLKELRFRAIGKAAPEIAGIDLEGRPMNTSEHRGRVVLLNFWGTWCRPCMNLIPHEVELAVKFKGRPFGIIGVNCDDDIEKALDAVARNKITWRSFRNKAGEETAITSTWTILGFPTVYLLDHHGIIRKRWIGRPTHGELAHATALLVDAAERKLAPDQMRPVVAALGHPPAAPKPVDAPSPAVAPRPGTGFLDKVYRAASDSDSKYVVFIPRTHDGTKAFPAILFLHGAGSRGSDGRLPIRGGLAKAIRDRKENFPFIVIFPQARQGESWTAESTGGKRALAILDQVQKEYQIDTERVYLTGLSMGGEGTWSLAASEPDRWAAIVPICHGWRTDRAARLKNIPCWCFHGDADRMIPPQQSRDMIKAIQDAGGKPLYQEFIGVDHDSCANHAYAMDELYEWLLLQNRPSKRAPRQH
jgi:predicted esterase/thiol-disulfide isomerase/thioredoxin